MTKKKLYSILTEKYIKGEWVGQPLIYAHAFSAEQAIYGYRLTLGPIRTTRIVHCGEVIGYFAEREDSKILTV